MAITSADETSTPSSDILAISKEQESILTTTSSNMINDIESSASDVDIDCKFSDLLESKEDDDESLSNLVAPLPTLLMLFQTPVHDQCSEESVFLLQSPPFPESGAGRAIASIL